MKHNKNISHCDIIVDIVNLYYLNPSKADEILSSKFNFDSNNIVFRRICQFIFLTLLRNKLHIEYSLNNLFTKKPKRKLYICLICACSEILMDKEEKAPLIINLWVGFIKDKYSKAEANFSNFILRKFSENYFSELNEDNSEEKSVEELSVRYSHPAWLIGSWLKEFGYASTIDILKQNQANSKVFVRMLNTPEAFEFFKDFADDFTKADFENFYILKSGKSNSLGEVLKSKYFYAQDPSTCFAPQHLDYCADGVYLDLCAAPGGKSKFIADTLYQKFHNHPDFHKSLLVSVDFGKTRMSKLQENLSKVDYIKSEVIECDLLNEDLEAKLKERNLPLKFDGVFLDAPCSNTGVLGRRPDTRYRINADDELKCAEIQIKMLNLASKFIKSKSKLVYSTCSIQASENINTINKFLSTNQNFKLIENKTILPSPQNDAASFGVFWRL